MPKIGIIGGSGLENAEFVKDAKVIKKHTPYGQPSDLITVGTIEGVDVVIIPRHGRMHRLHPTAVNFRANIWAMKELGVTHIIAPTACGSLQEHIHPGDFVFVDQFIDRTTKRKQTFYEGQEVCHISMAEPFCPRLRRLLVETAEQLGFKHHDKGTIVTIEGPRFSTKAESNLFRQWGCDVINMTTVPEAVLAREVGICYQPIAMVTDYDCWKEHAVTVEDIIKVMNDNAEKVMKLIHVIVPKIEDWECLCKEAIKSALL